MVTDQNLHLRMQALMGIQEDIQNKNSYRPHVRSEAGYDITQTTVVICLTAKRRVIITSDSFLTKYRISCCRLTTKLLQDTRVSWRRV